MFGSIVKKIINLQFPNNLQDILFLNDLNPQMFCSSVYDIKPQNGYCSYPTRTWGLMTSSKLRNLQYYSLLNIYLYHGLKYCSWLLTIRKQIRSLAGNAYRLSQTWWWKIWEKTWPTPKHFIIYLSPLTDLYEILDHLYKALSNNYYKPQN